MADVVGIISRYDLTIEEHRQNQLYKGKLAVYKPLLSLNDHLKQL